MKKYKLIKEYSGSPDINTIIEKITDNNHFFCPKNCYFTKGFIIDTNIIENYSEYWEEIIEKDYEILSFKQKSLIDDLWIIGNKGGWQRNGIDTTPQSTFTMLERTEMYYIHSVKRLNDGEVFTVGDEVIFNNSVSFTIKTFHISEGNRIACGDMEINYIKHIKKPLFTTEDGVDVFEGDEFYNTWDLLVPNKEIAESRKKDFYREKPVNKYCIYFSNKEKADEFILLNKKCLSINDVSNFYTSASNNLSKNSKGLIELVKDRLTKY